MTLEKLQAEMIAAMKNKNKERKEVISSLIQAVKKFAIDNKCKDNITEEQVNMVILKEKKTMQEMIDTCPVDRLSTKAEYEAKMVIINEFAPMLRTDPEDIEIYIRSLDIELTKENRGRIMAELKGRADMKVANAVLVELIK